MKRIALLVLILGFPIAVAATAGASHSSGNHWRRGSNPFTVQLINSTSGAWRDAVVRSAAKWSRSKVLDVAVEAASAQTSCSAPPGRVRVCSGNYSGSWAGLTELSVSGGHIQSGTIKLDNSAGSAKRAIACHEIGHALGLAHRVSKQTSSCMTATVSASQRRPDSHDFQQLKRIYAHGDGSGAKAADVYVVRIYTYLAR